MRQKRVEMPLAATSDQFHYDSMKLAYVTSTAEQHNLHARTHAPDGCLNKCLPSLASRSGTEMTCRKVLTGRKAATKKKQRNKDAKRKEEKETETERIRE